MSTEEGTLIHYGVKGQRWGVRTEGGGWSVGAGVSGGRQGAAKAPAGKAGPTSKAAPRPTRPAPSPSRNFKDASGKASATSTVASSKRTAEERARRRKMALGGAAVVGILGVAAVGYTTYKVSPKAMSAGKNASLKMLARPEVGKVKLAGARQANKAKLNVLVRTAGPAERLSKSGAGRNIAKAANDVKRNPVVARGAVRSDLNALRKETAALKSLTDGEDFVSNAVKFDPLRATQNRFGNEARNLLARRAMAKKAAAIPKPTRAEKRAAEDILKRFNNKPPKPVRVPGWAK